MKTHTTTWNADDRCFTLVHTDEVLTLSVDDQVLLTGGAAVFEPLARALRRRFVELPRNAGRPWTADEDAALAIGHAAGDTVPQLMAAFERSRGSIQARLVRLGLVDTASFAGRWRDRTP